MNKKPVVQYRSLDTPVIVGNITWLYCIDHPRQAEWDLEDDGTAYVHTSTVLSYDETKGIIETKNTIYVPEGYKGGEKK